MHACMHDDDDDYDDDEATPDITAPPICSAQRAWRSLPK